MRRKFFSVNCLRKVCKMLLMVWGNLNNLLCLRTSCESCFRWIVRRIRIRTIRAVVSDVLCGMVMILGVIWMWNIRNGRNKLMM